MVNAYTHMEQSGRKQKLAHNVVVSDSGRSILSIMRLGSFAKSV